MSRVCRPVERALWGACALEELRTRPSCAHRPPDIPPLASPAQLEMINGELWGNVWQTECIARVNVTTGVVVRVAGRAELQAEPAQFPPCLRPLALKL
jgi:hypothetical protein